MVPLGSIAGSMPGMGEKGAPVCDLLRVRVRVRVRARVRVRVRVRVTPMCDPSTTMSAAHAPVLSCLGETWLG